MAKKSKTAIPIGAVTNLTGISSHTLRKWESRHGVIEPERTDSGRRVYTQEHVRRLILLRDLVQRGHQIGRLSELSDAELEALLGEQAPAPTVAVDAVTAVGPILAATLARESTSLPQLELIAEQTVEWLDAVSDAQTEGEARALVVELPTVSSAAVSKLLQLRKDTYQRVVVVYGFTSRQTVQRLLDGGILCLKAPATAREILQNLQAEPAAESVADLLQNPAIPTHRFSQASVASLAALSPAIQCECPNHIAQLLMDISAFEQYSMECEDTDPTERELHARLRLIAANARWLFEEAMDNVARAEGLELEEL